MTLSHVCEAFTCPPDVAARQDWPTVQAVLDYRNARQALEWANGGEDGAKRLQEHPHLVALLKEMTEAQDAEDDDLSRFDPGGDE